MQRVFDARVQIFVDDEAIKRHREETGAEDGLEDEYVVADMLTDLEGENGLVFGEVEVADLKVEEEHDDSEWLM